MYNLLLSRHVATANNYHVYYTNINAYQWFFQTNRRAIFALLIFRVHHHVSYLLEYVCMCVFVFKWVNALRFFALERVRSRQVRFNIYTCKRTTNMNNHEYWDILITGAEWFKYNAQKSRVGLKKISRIQMYIDIAPKINPFRPTETTNRRECRRLEFLAHRMPTERNTQRQVKWTQKNRARRN